MITEQQIPQVLDHPLYDNHGSRVGDVKHVFLDDATGQPEWLCVKTGMFGSKETFVPTSRAEWVRDHVEAGYDKDFIKQAPNVDVDAGGHLSASEEQQLYRYYGIDWGAEQSAAGREGPAAVAGGPAAAQESTRGPERGPERGTDTGDDAMTRSEERLQVGKETHETGRVRLRKYVVTEEQQVTVPVSHEEVRVEREPITDENRDRAMSGPEISEAEHEVVLHEERPVVSKETTPVERVRATKETVTEEESVGGEVRKEHIEMEDDTRTRRRGRPDTPGR
ncbi:DUF2382 domain-containing protein [Thermomonospora amylolytica]|uniref:DUF2382 domain-containing protein n=1 Tax=Thermomonospora amylolytica TaxID=1411117 RepID=UPI000E6BF4F9|nr:PRC and DUF2382 domain-containing protein [Thermomonospora amylolytica]